MMNGSFYSPAWHHPLIGFLVFLVGACLGSFFNVCIYRIPLGRSIVFPSSRCAACGLALKGIQNIPLLGWLRQGGWCACGLTRIDRRYLIVELVTAGLSLALWWLMSPPLFLIYGLFLGGLLIASMIDIDHYIIPDRFSLGGLGMGLMASTLFPPLHHQATPWQGLQSSAIGAICGWLLLWSISSLGKLVFKKEAMGLGDVKLLAAMGSFLGWSATLYILAVSSMIGSVIGLLLLSRGPLSSGSRLPFGPFLSLAAATWIFGGAEWMTRYLASLSVLHAALP